MRNLNVNGLREAITSRVISFTNLILNSGATNFFRVKGTLPSSPSAPVTGVQFTIGSAGSAGQNQAGVTVSLLGGYTGNGYGFAFTVDNHSAPSGTGNQAGTSSGGYGIYVQMTTDSAAANAFGTGSFAVGSGARNHGVGGWAKAGSEYNVGVIGAADPASTSPFGGYFQLNSANPTAISGGAALVANNNTSGKPILICLENGSPAFTVDTLGNIKLSRIVTAAGTTGNQTINKPAGTVNFAAGAGVAGLVVTNSLVTASSIIQLTIRANDTTLKSVVYVAAAGSFTIFANANATAETSVGFLVTN